MWTTPLSPTSSIYSPMRNGLVKMMRRPATRFPRTPCVARPMPTPTTPIPATSGAIATPRLAMVKTAARRMTRSFETRTNSNSTGCSSLKRSSDFLTTRPTPLARKSPQIKMMMPPRIWKPYLTTNCMICSCTLIRPVSRAKYLPKARADEAVEGRDKCVYSLSNRRCKPL